MLTHQLQVLRLLPLDRQLPEQHSVPDVQLALLGEHEQIGSEMQAGSPQSIVPLQLSSMPLVHDSLPPPQSRAHTEQFSAFSQVLLPQQ